MQMTINILVLDNINEGREYLPVSTFRENFDEAFQEEEHERDPELDKQDDNKDASYLRWQIFDEVPERSYAIQCDGYFDEDEKPLTCETSINHFTTRKRLKLLDEDGNVIDCKDYYETHDRYTFSKRTKQITTKKLICEAPIGSEKNSSIQKWISYHETDRFMVIVPTVNITEKFYVKLYGMMLSDNEPVSKHKYLCVNYNAFNEFIKVIFNEVGCKITIEMNNRVEGGGIYIYSPGYSKMCLYMVQCGNALEC